MRECHAEKKRELHVWAIVSAPRQRVLSRSPISDTIWSIYIHVCIYFFCLRCTQPLQLKSDDSGGFSHGLESNPTKRRCGGARGGPIPSTAGLLETPFSNSDGRELARALSALERGRFVIMVPKFTLPLWLTQTYLSRGGSQRTRTRPSTRLTSTTLEN